VARWVRERSKEDRERSIRAQTSRIRRRGYRYQESRAVRDAKQALESGVLVAVLAHVHRLIAHPPKGEDARKVQIRYDAIEGTDLELAYSVDHGAREIRLLSLVPQGSPRLESSEQWQPGDPEYKVNLSPAVRAADRVLSVEEQKAADDIIATLAEDPSGCEHLAAPIEGGQMIRRHPSPSLEVTYSVDDARRTVNVVHVSAPIQAGRTLFVSYSHEDKEWWKKVMTYVHQLEEEGLIRIWSDELIKAGDRWNDSIVEALDSSQAALLLVSQSFINSTFINEEELPRILDRAAQGVTKIFWIPVRVSTVFTTHKTITEFQSLLLPPTTPLNKLEEQGESKCEEALLQIYENLRRALVG
jgi:hypothetical protein